MIKKIVSVFLTLAFIFSLVSVTFATETDNEFEYNRVLDYSKKISKEDITILNRKSKYISNNYNYDCYCMTISSDNDDSSFSIKMISQLSQYSGNNDIVFMYIEDDGSFSIEAVGRATDSFSSDVIDIFHDHLEEYVNKGNVFETFKEYLNLCDKCSRGLFVKDITDEKSDNTDEESIEQEETHFLINPANKLSLGKIIVGIVIGIICGCVVAFLICNYFKSKMDNTGLLTDADTYIDEKLNLTEQQERLIKKTVSKRKLENNK